MIKDDAGLGMNIIVLKGGTVGKRTVVAANSAVTKSLYSYILVAGNPAEVIRSTIR